MAKRFQNDNLQYCRVARSECFWDKLKLSWQLVSRLKYNDVNISPVAYLGKFDNKVGIEYLKQPCFILVNVEERGTRRASSKTQVLEFTEFLGAWFRYKRGNDCI